MCGAEVPEELLLSKEQVEHLNAIAERDKKEMDKFRERHKGNESSSFSDIGI